MRLHALEITAFGPFAAQVQVDFDQLSEAGLFLLTGATGAGKSSILDAVCFALYGDVPGDRGAAKRLRCDQAAEGVAPRVRLEATLSGRRFRIERSPAWERPKKRGSGTTVEPAHVVVSEFEHGGWRPLSTRLDESGHLITRLVGMNLAQFCQVALLPQGRFQAFLRARSEERHALLQQVFRTTRFDRIEGWLRDHRVDLRRESEVHHRRVADLVSRVSEAAGRILPAEWDVTALAGPASTGELAAWVGDLHTDIVAEAEAAEASRDLAHRGERQAQDLMAAGQELAARLQRLHRATTELATLDLAATAHEQDRLVLRQARQAESLRPLHHVATESTRKLADARAVAAYTLDATWSALGASPVPDADAPDELERLRRAVVADRDRAQRALPLDAHAEQLAAEEERLRAEAAGHEERLAELDSRAVKLPATLEAARSEREIAVRAAAALPGARTVVSALREAAEAAAEVAALEPELAEARGEHQASVLALQRAKETWLELREARLEGMAAEIAGRLAVGACCPVCGSAEHPRPAFAPPGAPDSTAEKVARQAVDDLEVVVQAREERARTLSTRIAGARTAAGSDPDSLEPRRSAAEAELAGLERRAAAVDRLDAQVRSLMEEESGLARRREEIRAAWAELNARITRARDEHTRAAAEVADVLADSGCEDLATLSALLDTRDRACTEALTALAELDRTRAAATEATRTLTAACSDAGFADLDAVLQAMLDVAGTQAIEARIEGHVRSRERLRETLADPDLQGLRDTDAPDLAALAASHEKALHALESARRHHDVSATRRERVGRLAAELGAALEEWRPVREELADAIALAAFAEGRSGDNRLQMRLSAYVLAHRLSQVVESANLRLTTMSDQRYRLEHIGRRGAGESRGGLSLLVRDDWSGEGRDPATLSGGETFVVSLALALGLADVITQEAGGADLDTLFVDEGFGSLDADTLDDVMDTLDSLRDGGRVVGVVSHVAELQTRIPAQLRVLKHRTGSRVEASTG